MKWARGAENYWSVTCQEYGGKNFPIHQKIIEQLHLLFRVCTGFLRDEIIAGSLMWILVDCPIGCGALCRYAPRNIRQRWLQAYIRQRDWCSWSEWPCTSWGKCAYARGTSRDFAAIGRQTFIPYFTRDSAQQDCKHHRRHRHSVKGVPWSLMIRSPIATDRVIMLLVIVYV